MDNLRTMWDWVQEDNDDYYNPTPKNTAKEDIIPETDPIRS